MFFGLYLFWIILSRRYRALGPQDDLLTERPQVRGRVNAISSLDSLARE